MAFNKKGARELYMLKWRTQKSNKANYELYTSSFLQKLVELDSHEERIEFLEEHIEDRDKVYENISIILYPYAFDFRVFVDSSDDGIEEDDEDEEVTDFEEIEYEDYYEKEYDEEVAYIEEETNEETLDNTNEPQKEEKIEKNSLVAWRQNISRKNYNAPAMLEAVVSALKHYEPVEEESVSYEDVQYEELPIHGLVYYVGNLYINIAKRKINEEYFGKNAPKTALKLMNEVNSLRNRENLDLNTAIEIVIDQGNNWKSTISSLKALIDYANTENASALSYEDGDDEHLFENGHNFFDVFNDNDNTDDKEKLGLALARLAANLENMTIDSRNWTMLGVTGIILKNLKYKNNKPIQKEPACNIDIYKMMYPHKDILVNDLFEFGFIEYLLNDSKRYPFRSFKGVSQNTFKNGRLVQQKYLAEYKKCTTANVSLRLKRNGFTF